MQMIKFLMLVYGTCALIALILYLPRILGFRYAFKPFPQQKTNKKRRLAILIPARNESQIIGDLFQSIVAQNYDQACFETFVIVKESNDPTIELAQQRNFNVTVVSDQHCKGDALHGFFRWLPQNRLASFDAFVIVDADGVLDSQFLAEVNRALENSAEIVITRKMTKNFFGGRKSRSLFANCAALTWPMIDELGNAYRTVKHMPLNLCGQGLVVRRNVIEQNGGWPFRSLTEDYELKLESLVRDYRSIYYPHAVLYTEEAVGHKENFIRRVRWLTGFCQSVKQYRHRIRAKIKTEKRLNRGEFEYFMGIVPYLVYLVGTILTMLGGVGLSVYFAIIKSSLWLHALVSLVLVPFGVTYLLLHWYSILALFTTPQRFRNLTIGERIAMVFYNPFYILEYLPAYLVALTKLHQKRPLRWKSTERLAPEQRN